MSDPRALRALAHPTRLALLGELRRHGPLTATQAAPRVGESVASCSFHLRQLAKYGMVEPALTSGGREKPWRASAETTDFDLAPDDPEAAEASGVFAQVLIDRYAQRMRAAVARYRSESAEWREAMLVGDSILYLTEAELHALRRQVEAIADRYRERFGDPTKRPNGARLVDFIHWAVPE